MYQFIHKLNHPRGIPCKVVVDSCTNFVVGKRRRTFNNNNNNNNNIISKHLFSNQSSTIGDQSTHHSNNKKEEESKRLKLVELVPNPFTEQSNELVKEIADNIRDSVRSYTSNQHNKPSLIGISTSKSFYSNNDNTTSDNGNNQQMTMFIDEGIESYSDSVSKSCLEDGINYELWRVPGGKYSTNIVHQVNNLIRRANVMDGVHGILVYYPLLSSKPEILGWDTHTYYHDSVSRGGDDRKNNNYGSIDLYGNRKWTLEQQQYNLEKGCEEILHHYQKSIPGLTYKTRDDHYRNLINYQRDVEGLSSYHRHQLRTMHKKIHYPDSDDKDADNSAPHGNNNIIFPCTPMAVMKVLQKVKSNLQDTTITIINRSETFGRPLAFMLSNERANVFSIDESSILLYNQGKIRRLSPISSMKEEVPKHPIMNVQECVMKSDILVTAVPSPEYEVPTDWIQPNTIVVNVASETNVNEDELSLIPGVKYFPQIGKVTVALLEYNLITLHQNQHNITRRVI